MNLMPLRDYVAQTLKQYFNEIDMATPPNDMYDLVVAEVEHPLLEAVLLHTRGNQSKAAKILGINRGTLRKKLIRYGMVTES